MSSEEVETRVLIVAPTGGDAKIAHRVLESAGIRASCCHDVTEVCSAIRSSGAGALLMAEEALTKNEIHLLLDLLEKQEPWSDLPVVIIGGHRSGHFASASYDVLGQTTNLTLLERPLNPVTLVTTLRSGLRARGRQYEVRKLLKEREVLLDAERAAHEEAVSANRIKDDFLATVSHELRNPLNSILGFSQLLQRGTRTQEEIRNGLAIIERNSRAQAALIDDLLDISRIVSGKLRLASQEVDLGAIVRVVVESVSPSAENKHVTLAIEISEDSCFVVGDPARLQQVIANLLGNAVKFSKSGGRVLVKLSRAGSFVVLQVVDWGVGISKEFLPYVFDRFRQEAAQTNRGAMGLGLGLSIVRHLVEMHNGRVDVSSEGEGKGATFTVVLPVAREVEEGRGRGGSTVQSVGEIADGETHRLQGVTVLAVDDEPDSRVLIRKILEEHGAAVYTAGSVREALLMFCRVRPSVVVSDISMPEEDGYVLIDRIRELREHGGGEVPAVAVTAFARAEDRGKSLKAGYQAHLAKPVDPAELTATIASFVHVAS